MQTLNVFPGYCQENLKQTFEMLAVKLGKGWFHPEVGCTGNVTHCCGKNSRRRRGYKLEKKNGCQLPKTHKEEKETEPVALAFYKVMWVLIWEQESYQNIWQHADSGQSSSAM